MTATEPAASDAMPADTSPRPAPAPPRPVLLSPRAAAEFVGTAALVTIVVGSGIQATGLTDDVALQLLANSTATFAGIAPASVPAFIGMQLIGAIAGLALVAVVFMRPRTNP
ncbi:hypothetical protein [Streptomyces sp. NPDC054975]